MPARKSYGYNYYESGSAARKIDYTYDEKKARSKNSEEILELIRNNL